MFIIFSLLRFWLTHPALLYGLSFLLGLFFQLEASSLLIVPCLALWLPFISALFISPYRYLVKHFILSLLIFFTAWSILTIHYTFPSLENEKISGLAHVKIKSLRLSTSLFGEKWVYESEIQQFFPDSSSLKIKYLPCLICLPTRALRPLANQDYWIAGKLTQTDAGSYLLKVSPKTKWLEIPQTWSLAESRYQWKKNISQWIKSHFSSSLSGSFLAGLATGDFDDYWMKQQFARFGLQHLLAISGFHFAIIASFLSFILRLFFPQFIQIPCLLLCLSIYTFFLGPQPSILRASLMCLFSLIGGLIDKQTTALNSLGLALLIILGYDPLLSQTLAFQLSFATTAAILIFYQPFLSWLYEIFPKRPLQEVLEMPFISQHVYCLIAFLRQGLALTLAVNLFALPLTLYYFNQFPFMSLLYNFFFPLLASFSICLLLLGSLFIFIPFLASAIHSFNDRYTGFILQLTYQIPSDIDTYLGVDFIPIHGLIIYFCMTFLGGIIWKERQLNEKEWRFI